MLTKSQGVLTKMQKMKTRLQRRRVWQLPQVRGSHSQPGGSGDLCVARLEGGVGRGVPLVVLLVSGDA